MKVGIAFSTDPDSMGSGKEVARKAMIAGKLNEAHLVLSFCSDHNDHEAFYKGLRMTLGPEPPIIGGSALGIITNDGIFYEKYSAGVLILESSKIGLHVTSSSHIDRDEAQAGRVLAERLPNDAEAKLLLIFYDSIRVPAIGPKPPVMNASPPLIQGIESALQPEVPIVGAGLLGNLAFQPTYQFCGHHVAQQSATGVLMSGNFKHYSKIMHGCTPLNGIYHTITRSNEAEIYEVDGKPIVDLINELYGSKEWQYQKPVKRLTIGVNYGEKFSEFDEDNFVNRLISGVLPNREGILLFEPDLAEGTEIIFMLRDAHEMIRSAKESTKALMDQIVADGAKPVCAIFFDCAGRAARFSETLTEEASEVVDILNHHGIPLLGFYSGVEIAPLLGRSRGLDWTGFLLIFAQ